MNKALRMIPAVVGIGLILVCVAVCGVDASVNLDIGSNAVRRITAEDYVDKMKAGRVGQMAGVG
jgi:hypothetical protein